MTITLVAHLNGNQLEELARCNYARHIRVAVVPRPAVQPMGLQLVHIVCGDDDGEAFRSWFEGMSQLRMPLRLQDAAQVPGFNVVYDYR